jgi:protein SCO1
MMHSISSFFYDVNDRVSKSVHVRIRCRIEKGSIKLRNLLTGLMMLGAALLAGCQREEPWRLTAVDNQMPSLDFTLTRAKDGKTVTTKDYRGQIVVLEFGYTSCPDICPTTLANLTSALDKLGEKAKVVRVLFVTVDPNRDTRDSLNRYGAAFSPQIDGLRGTDIQLKDLAHRYRVAYSVSPSKDPKEYEVTHSSIIFIFDRTGRIKLLSTNPDNAADLAHDLGQLAREQGG